MATANPFDMLGDNDNDDSVQLIVAAKQQQQNDAVTAKKVAPPVKKAPLQPTQAKLPSKPLPPAQAVREAKNEVGSGRGADHGSPGSGQGRSSGFYRDSKNNENSFNNEVAYGATEDLDSMKTLERVRGSYRGSHSSFRGGRRGGFSNVEVREGDQLRRQFERHSGIARGNWIKRDGGGRGHWGSPADDIAQVTEVSANANKQSPENLPLEEDTAVADKEATAVADKEATAVYPEAKEPEDKEMTLDEYEKLLAEKRKAFKASKTEERKVDLKEFESMQQLSSKKDTDDVFIKLGSDRDKRKEIADKEEKQKRQSA